ncbi:MAG: adaptor protein MecA [Ruminococcaceae bacterium]|nr:adaptor protein MecA [Oscillospiraceae bacterium]
MKILKINKNSILIELEVMPQSMTDTVRDAFSRVGKRAQAECEITCFAGHGGVLIFAKQKPLSCAVYRFDSFENMIGGAQEILHTCMSPTTLIYFENAYFLILSDEMESLTEFGNAVESPDEISAYLHEYGTVLCRDNAIEKLTAIFH